MAKFVGKNVNDMANVVLPTLLTLASLNGMTNRIGSIVVISPKVNKANKTIV
jgi:hypothetical protein